MSTFNSPKYQAVANIISQEMAVESTLSIRQRCLKRIVDECGMTEKGASTYFANKYKEMNGSNMRQVERPITAANLLEEAETDEPVFSMVTVDKARNAVDVRCYTDKMKCLNECNRLGKHFIVGHQQRNAKLGVLVSRKAVNEIIPDTW